MTIRAFCCVVAAFLCLVTDDSSAFPVFSSAAHQSLLGKAFNKPKPSRSLASTTITPQSITFLYASSDNNEEEEFFDFNKALEDGTTPVIIRGSENDDIDGSIWEDLETGQPPQYMVMKEMLGISGFTYILGALIVFFFSMNFFLGPGWLGGVIGVPGTGSIKDVSDSFPGTVDLSSPEFRL